ncbi:MAG: hypothetical protein LBU85_10880, partial [Treponema sp.]|nr:hypothetical protein [Treponema sp.]
MPVKTSVKKTTRTYSPRNKSPQTAKKPVERTAKKTAKKVTWDDIEAGFEKLQKSQDEAWAAIRETQQAHRETEKAIKDTQKAVKETQKNIGGL